MIQIITPNHLVKDLQKPLIFLAGPIRGAPRWRDVALRYILNSRNDIYIATPEKNIYDNDLKAFAIKSGDSYLSRQREWERHYLNHASIRGAIMFWLPQEVAHNCDVAYGSITKLELGQWMTKFNSNKNLRIAIGCDGNFSEWHTIKYDLSQDAPEIKIKNTLEETCDEAIRLACKTKTIG